MYSCGKVCLVSILSAYILNDYVRGNQFTEVVTERLKLLTDMYGSLKSRKINMQRIRKRKDNLDVKAPIDGVLSSFSTSVRAVYVHPSLWGLPFTSSTFIFSTL